MYDKFLKCEFWLSYIALLGHVASMKGIRVDPNKIEALWNWSIPTSPIVIPSLVLLKDYYRWFIQGFSTIAAPLSKWHWRIFSFIGFMSMRSAFKISSPYWTTPILILLMVYPMIVKRIFLRVRSRSTLCFTIAIMVPWLKSNSPG